MRELVPQEVRFLRMRAQRLLQTVSRESAEQLLRDVCGVQAQEAAAASLAVWVRGGETASALERARVEAASIVRTWCMRGTLHLLPAGDIHWLLDLLGPVFVRKTRRRYEELGLTEALCARGADLVRRFLGAEGPLTRAELAKRLAKHGIPTEGQAAYHLLRRAALEGAICYGPDRSGEPAFVLLEDWLQPGTELAGNDAFAELARRYLRAYGPAGPEDMATWSGLSLRHSRRAFDEIAEERIEVVLEGEPLWVLEEQAGWLEAMGEAGSSVRLLPAYDPYLLGYRSRELSVPDRFAKHVHPGGGLLRPTLLVDGLAAGTWKLKRNGDKVEVLVEPFGDLGPRTAAALEAEATDMGRYLEVEAVLRLDAAPIGK